MRYFFPLSDSVCFRGHYPKTWEVRSFEGYTSKTQYIRTIPPVKHMTRELGFWAEQVCSYGSGWKGLISAKSKFTSRGCRTRLTGTVNGRLQSGYMGSFGQVKKQFTRFGHGTGTLWQPCSDSRLDQAGTEAKLPSTGPVLEYSEYSARTVHTLNHSSISSYPMQFKFLYFVMV